MELVLEVLTVFAMGMVKFAFSQLMATGLGFGYLATLLITVLGGCTGMLVFYFGSGWFMERVARRKQKRLDQGKDPKRSFTRTNRTIVRVKRSQGLSGLAFLTPVLISIPIGAIIAAKYFRNDRRTLPILLASVVIWGVILTSFWQFFQ